MPAQESNFSAIFSKWTPAFLWKFAANSQAVPYFVVGGDAHIDPLGSYEFAADYRKNGAICRADRVVRPYAV